MRTGFIAAPTRTLAECAHCAVAPSNPAIRGRSHRSPGINTMAGKTSKKPAKVAKKAAVKSSDDLSASKRIDKKIPDLADWIVERLAAIRGSSAESVGRIEVLLKDVWVG